MWTKTIQNMSNMLDRDVVLKKALGVPPEAFERSDRLLLNQTGEPGDGAEGSIDTGDHRHI